MIWGSPPKVFLNIAFARIRGNFKSKMGLLRKIIVINFGGRMKKTTFCVHIFDISPYCFTQILSGRACWMHNLIMHLMSTRTAYFWWTPLPQKEEIPEKTWWWHHHHHVFQVFRIFGVARSIKSMHYGYSLDAELNSTSNKLSC